MRALSFSKTSGRLNELCGAGVDSEGFHFDKGKIQVCECVCTVTD